MASKFKDVELVNEAGDKRIATSPAQYAQFTFDGFYVDDDDAVLAQLTEDKAAAAAEEKAAADAAEKAADAPAVPAKTPAGKPAASGNTAAGEKTSGSNPS